MEEKIFIAKLLHYFDFSTRLDKDAAMVSELILRPDGGFPFHATPRRPLP